MSGMRAAVLAILLAGCAEATPPPGATTVRVEPRQGVTQPLARGETDLVVRAIAAGREFAGADCEAVSPYFAGRFTAPARVLMPDLGSQSPPVSVACRAGALSGSATSAPQASWSGGLGGWPAVGISVGTGGGDWDGGGVGVGFGWWGGGYGARTGEPTIRYPDLRVEMQ